MRLLGVLYDTSVLSALLDTTHSNHNVAREFVLSLPGNVVEYISVITLAELKFGVYLPKVITGKSLPKLENMISDAQQYAAVEISPHTAEAYASIKSKMAGKYLIKANRKHRAKYIEDWTDKNTGKKLQVDENDLWLCAQSKERGLTLVTSDPGMQRIADADKDVELKVLHSQ